MLAGERQRHIINRKVFYVRFIKPEGVEVVSDENGSLECNRKVRNHNNDEFYLHFEVPEHCLYLSHRRDWIFQGRIRKEGSIVFRVQLQIYDSALKVSKNVILIFM